MSISLYNFILADNIEALKDCWIVGDKFAFQAFPSFRNMKTAATITKKKPPYLYQFYNISSYCTNQLSHNRNGMSHILNSFIEGLNNNLKLPKYVIFVPDKDLVENHDHFDFGAQTIFDMTLESLFKKVNMAITRRREDMFYKRPGSLASYFEQRVIWLKIINRPTTGDKKMREKMILREKFNNTLETQFPKEKQMFIMNIDAFESDDAQFLFTATNELTSDGYVTFWSEVTKMMKFEYDEISLAGIPKAPPTFRKSKNGTKGKKSQPRFKLPTPPRKQGPR